MDNTLLHQLSRLLSLSFRPSSLRFFFFPLCLLPILFLSFRWFSRSLHRSPFLRPTSLSGSLSIFDSLRLLFLSPRILILSLTSRLSFLSLLSLTLFLLSFDLRFLHRRLLLLLLRRYFLSLPLAVSVRSFPFCLAPELEASWSCYNPESADGRPMYGSLFYAGCAALRCTPRRARAPSEPSVAHHGSKHARYIQRIALATLLNKRPHVTRWRG